LNKFCQITTKSATIAEPKLFHQLNNLTNRFGRTGGQAGRPVIIKPVQVQRSNPNSLARFSLAHPSSAAARERKTRGAERRGYHGTAYGSRSSRGKHPPSLNTRSRHTLRCARYSTRERKERERRESERQQERKLEEERSTSK
jgi:hypothetical protein